MERNAFICDGPAVLQQCVWSNFSINVELYFLCLTVLAGIFTALVGWILLVGGEKEGRNNMSDGACYWLGLTIGAGIITVLAVWANWPLLAKKREKDNHH